MSLFSRRTLVAASVAVAASLAVPGMPTAYAHDSVIGGNPADGETLQEFPDEVALEFSGYVLDDFNTFAVTDTDTGEVLFSGEPEINERWVSLPVPADVDPGPGEYRIGFQITSSDGHSTRGWTSFNVAGGETGDGTSAAQQADEADTVAQDASEESTGISPWVWIAGGLVLLAAIVAGIIAASRRSK